MEGRMELVARELPPRTLLHGRYRIEKVLGAGGFGITYLAEDEQEECPVAVKEYMPLDVAVRLPGSPAVMEQKGKKAQYERFRSRFLEEAKLIYRYREHPNIVQVRHLFYENNTAYYIMEFMEGLDLGRLLKQQESSLPWEYLKGLMAQAVSALHALHESGMVHCDISPDNLFILRDGTLKLIDFGAAKSVMSGQSSVIILKKGFAPLEQYKSRGSLGSWTDIYALAVTIYLAVTGIMPPQSTERAVQDNILWTQELGIQPPTTGWEGAMKKALALYPEQRFSDVTEFWQELNGEAEPCSYPVLEGISGTFRAQRLLCSGELLLGTDRQSCQICYPLETAGVSRIHMRLWEEQGNLMVMDMRSTYGSYLNGMKMTPGLVYTAEPGAVIELGKNQMFRYVAREDKW